MTVFDYIGGRKGEQTEYRQVPLDVKNRHIKYFLHLLTDKKVIIPHFLTKKGITQRKPWRVIIQIDHFDLNREQWVDTGLIPREI